MKCHGNISVRDYYFTGLLELQNYQGNPGYLISFIGLAVLLDSYAIVKCKNLKSDIPNSYTNIQDIPINILNN